MEHDYRKLTLEKDTGEIKKLILGRDTGVRGDKKYVLILDK